MTRTGVLLILLALYSCGGSGGGGATVRVHPGESIQAAVDAAPANATILVEPGVYHESAAQPSAVIITKDGIQLIGLSTPGAPVVLENAGGQKNGIWMSPADSVKSPSDGEHPPCGENGALLHGFVLQGFTVRGFDQFGVYLGCVDGFTLSHNSAEANQLYGLFPVRSHNGTIERQRGAGHAVGRGHLRRAERPRHDHAEPAHDSLLGLEIENSSDVTATNNELYDNTLGMVADINVGLQKKDQTNVLIADNDVHDNNRPNTIDVGRDRGDPARDRHRRARRLDGDGAPQHGGEQRLPGHHRRPATAPA